ncbi:MAB_1171c family putative transporter [Micromonospora wenchangensis]|uniref:MAB_1171c family putative transporter n=1 Tax=Micromonospora wenchangensis TaxID=1185415 RepID=UPI0011829D43|nr:MAB_1171c family putative transporter [Micromonospora wenchangensis]
MPTVVSPIAHNRLIRCRSMSHANLVNGVFVTTGTILASTAILSAAGDSARTPARTALTVSLGTLGLSFLIQSPAARGAQNLVVTNLGQLTGNGTTLVAAYALQVMVLHILYGRADAVVRARRWLVALLLALAAMTSLFLSTPTPADRFTSPDAPGGIVAYYLVFTGYLGATVTSLFLLIHQYAAHTSDRMMRINLVLQQWACVTGMIYFAGRIAALSLNRLGIDVEQDDRFGLIEFVVAAVVPGVGVTLSMTGVVLKTVGRWRQYRNTHRRLRPLWEAAREVRPHAVLPVPHGRGGARLRLYRRVIEIQDAQLAAGQRVGAGLRRQIDDAVDDAALTGEAARAVREAAVFAAGLAALRDDRTQPACDVGVAAAPADEKPDLGTVVRRLEDVSDAYGRSPIVKRFGRTSDPGQR